jgi:ornithine cyclodeaminase
VILTPPMIAPGMHINGVGGDCPGKTELHGDVLRMPDMRVVVEYEPQSRIEGEIQQMPADFPVIELAQVVRGEAVARRSARDITLFDSVGFALEDYSALRFLHSIISAQRLGRRDLDLVPDLDDPKDLFGGTLSSQRGRARKRKSA